MIVTRKDAVRIIRANVRMSAVDRIVIPYGSCRCYVQGTQPHTNVAGVAVQKISPDRNSAIRIGRLFRTGIIDWNATFGL